MVLLTRYFSKDSHRQIGVPGRVSRSDPSPGVESLQRDYIEDHAETVVNAALRALPEFVGMPHQTIPVGEQVSDAS